MGIVGFAVRKFAVGALIFIGVVGAGGYTFSKLPTGFVPQEDMGYLLVSASSPTPPQAADVRWGRRSTRSAETEGVEASVALIGYFLIDGAASSSTVSFIVVLDPWDERATPETSLRGVITGLMAQFQEIPDAQIFAFPVPDPRRRARGRLRHAAAGPVRRRHHRPRQRRRRVFARRLPDPRSRA